jgi:hypothetical protein
MYPEEARGFLIYEFGAVLVLMPTIRMTPGMR